MKPTIKIFFFITLSFCFCYCSNNYNKSYQPAFLKNDKTIDSLTKAYNCETIEFNSWENKKPEDSCLTVCLINSTKVPLIMNMETSFAIMKGIASSIKKALKSPQAYKSYSIVFIKKEKFGAEMEARSPSTQMKIQSSEL